MGHPVPRSSPLTLILGEDKVAAQALLVQILGHEQIGEEGLDTAWQLLNKAPPSPFCGWPDVALFLLHYA